VELTAEPLYHLGRKLRIHGINLAGLARRKVNDQKRRDRDKEQGDDLLNDAAADER
jgi:hypothetical protein